jgi:hypothetical protein
MSWTIPDLTTRAAAGPLGSEMAATDQAAILSNMGLVGVTPFDNALRTGPSAGLKRVALTFYGGRGRPAGTGRSGGDRTLDGYAIAAPAVGALPQTNTGVAPSGGAVGPTAEHERRAQAQAAQASQGGGGIQQQTGGNTVMDALYKVGAFFGNNLIGPLTKPSLDLATATINQVGRETAIGLKKRIFQAKCPPRRCVPLLRAGQQAMPAFAQGRAGGPAPAFAGQPPAAGFATRAGAGSVAGAGGGKKRKRKAATRKGGGGRKKKKKKAVNKKKTVKKKKKKKAAKKGGGRRRQVGRGVNGRFVSAKKKTTVVVAPPATKGNRSVGGGGVSFA